MDEDRDELRTLRGRLAELEALALALEAGPGAGPGVSSAVTVNNGSYPTAGAVGRVFAIKLTEIAGAESEGGAATVATRTEVAYAVNLAAGLPPAGTEVVVADVPYRKVFYYP
jgi:hypothetical protein